MAGAGSGSGAATAASVSSERVEQRFPGPVPLLCAMGGCCQPWRCSDVLTALLGLVWHCHAVPAPTWSSSWVGPPTQLCLKQRLPELQGCSVSLSAVVLNLPPCNP